MIRINIVGGNASEELRRLISAFSNPQSALKSIGEAMLAFTKGRFRVGQDPYGTPWPANKPSTLRKFLRLNRKNYNRDKSLSERGVAALARKRPLIGETRSLSTQLFMVVLGSSVEVRSTMEYAAMMNFGGTKEQFPHLWGDIPARAFFPNERNGFPLELSNKTGRMLRAAIMRHRT